MILACPTCDSRYDVTGYPAGQQFRCRCGTVVTLQAPATQAGMLTCPHCGAGVSEDSQRCEHCNSELLLKSCPRCLARVFAGHQHCPGCGADLELAATGTARPDLPCPRCDTPMRARLVGDVVSESPGSAGARSNAERCGVVIDECGTCLGLFLDHVAIRRVIEDRAQARAEALLGALPRHEIKAQVAPGQRMYVKCPSCRTVMNRKLFATGAGVIVDVCRAHGTFFDAGELPAVIEFVRKGGLAEAERRDLARERDQLRAASAATWSVDPGPSSGTALVDLLSLLTR